MRVLIVYETMYGTNRMIADAIAAGMNEVGSVTIIEAGSAPATISADVDLLVVGGPNHITGLPSPKTRAQAAAESSETIISPGPGLREWLKKLQISKPIQPVAVWDTRMSTPRILDLFSHSSQTIAKGLSRLGARLVCKPQKFYSADGIGALKEGEEEKARLWGAELVNLVG